MLRKRLIPALVLMASVAACGGPNTLPGGLSFVLSRFTGASSAPPGSDAAQSGGVSQAPTSHLAVAAMTQNVDAFLAANQGPQVKNFPAKAAVQTLKVQLSGVASGTTAVAEEGLGGTPPSVDAAFFRAHSDLITHTGTGVSSGYRVANLPTSVDLRPRMPPVRDQGPRGTCVMFSTAGIVDFLASEEKSPPIAHSSPEFMDWLYQIEVKKPGAPDIWTDDGTMPEALHMVLRQDGNYGWGIPPLQGYLSEEVCPYRPNLQDAPATIDPFTESEQVIGDGLASQIAARQNFLSQGANFIYLPDDLQTLKGVLAAGVPVQIAIPVYPADWYFVDASHHYEVPEMTQAKWPYCGGHSVALVGYIDDATAPGGGWFLMRNSWSAGWGDGGYCRLSYNFVVQNAWDYAYAQLYPQPFSAQYDVFPAPHGGPGPVVNTPTPNPTSTPTQGPTASPTETPSSSPTATPTASPTASPDPTPSDSPTPTPSPNGLGFPFTSITLDPSAPGGVLVSWTTSIPVKGAPIQHLVSPGIPEYGGEVWYHVDGDATIEWYEFDPQYYQLKTSGSSLVPYNASLVAGKTYDYYVYVGDADDNIYKSTVFTFVAPPAH